jgi:hypothetical protein
MIKYENKMLVLDSSHTKDDQLAVNSFVNTIRDQEREHIKKILDSSRDCKCKETCKTDVNIYAFVLEELGFDLFKLIDGDKSG